jgi:hypothetical protein
MNDIPKYSVIFHDLYQPGKIVDQMTSDSPPLLPSVGDMYMSKEHGTPYKVVSRTFVDPYTIIVIVKNVRGI